MLAVVLMVVEMFAEVIAPWIPGRWFWWVLLLFTLASLVVVYSYLGSN